MSEAKAITVAREVLNAHVEELDNQIRWSEQSLAGLKSDAISAAMYLDHLRQKRSALKDAVAVNFPVAVR